MTTLSSQTNRRILIVDDEPHDRKIMQCYVDKLGHTPIIATSGPDALRILDSTIDLVLMDTVMPNMDGFAVTRAIRSHSSCCDIPIILYTASAEAADRLAAVESGASDFLSKPIQSIELRVRMTSLLRIKDAQDAIRRQQAELETIVAMRTVQLQIALDHITEAHLETVHRLALAAEYRDGHTAAHLERVGQYCALLGRASGLNAEETDMLYHASTMHDVGKIGIPDAILLKPGLINDEERALMQDHTRIGAKLLGGSSSKLLQSGEVIAWTHHERWDGAGYPRGLAGDAIPLWGRICAIADVFDALTSTRPYKPAFSLHETRQLMCEGRSTQFDPVLLDLFLEYFDEVMHIWKQNQDR